MSSLLFISARRRRAGCRGGAGGQHRSLAARCGDLLSSKPPVAIAGGSSPEKGGCLLGFEGIQHVSGMASAPFRRTQKEGVSLLTQKVFSLKKRSLRGDLIYT